MRKILAELKNLIEALSSVTSPEVNVKSVNLKMKYRDLELRGYPFVLGAG